MVQIPCAFECGDCFRVNQNQILADKGFTTPIVIRLCGIVHTLAQLGALGVGGRHIGKV